MAWHDQQALLDGLEWDMRSRLEALERAGVDVPSGERTQTVDLTTSAGLAEMGIQVRQRADDGTAGAVASVMSAVAATV